MTTEQNSTNIVYAGTGGRIIATIMDFLLITMFLYILALLSFVISMSVPTIEEYYTYIAIIIQATVLMLYFPIAESSKMQGSLGKHIFRIKIVNQDGSRASFYKIFLRNLIKGSLIYILQLPEYLSTISLAALLFILFLIPVLLDKRKRGIHDMICGTYVVRK